MLTKTALIAFSTLTTLTLVTLPVKAETGETGTQDAYIGDGSNNNTINQTINQYIFKNPGRGAIQRKQPIDGPNVNQGKGGQTRDRYDNREWGQQQGKERGRHGHNR